jgi:hypothetical protein
VGPTQTIITAPACRKVEPDQAVTPANHTNQVGPDQADQVGPDQAVRANGLLLDHQVGRAATARPKSGSSRAWGLIRQVGQVLVPVEWDDRGRGATDSGGDTVDVGFPQSRGAVGAGSS